MITRAEVIVVALMIGMTMIGEIDMIMTGETDDGDEINFVN